MRHIRNRRDSVGIYWKSRAEQAEDETGIREQGEGAGRTRWPKRPTRDTNNYAFAYPADILRVTERAIQLGQQAPSDDPGLPLYPRRYRYVTGDLRLGEATPH